MVKVLLCGAFGKMGKMIADCIENDNGIEIVCGVDKGNGACNFPVFNSFDEVTVTPDVIIDFSSPLALNGLLQFAQKHKIPAVLATTGYNESQIENIKKASETIPIFFSFNMSLGINLLCALSKKAAAVLGDNFDIEIIEKHHNQKVDAPSGTAIMLANAINEQSNDKFNYEYDRHSKRAKRSKNEIGIHSVRGGTIVGEHEVIFAGNDEIISLTHTATSKAVFANGAVKAAKFIAGKNAGMYDMNDII